MSWIRVAGADLRLVARSKAARAVAAIYFALALLIAGSGPNDQFGALVLTILALVPAISLWMTCGLIVRERALGHTLAVLESGVTRDEYLLGKLASRVLVVTATAGATVLVGALAWARPSDPAILPPLVGALAIVLAPGIAYAVAGIGISAATSSPVLAATLGTAIYVVPYGLCALVLQTYAEEIGRDLATGPENPLLAAIVSADPGPAAVAGLLGLAGLLFVAPLAAGIYRFRRAELY